MIYNVTEHQFILDLKKAYPKIKEEYESFIGSEGYKTWPEEHIHNGRWNVFGFTFLKKKVEIAHQMCPHTSKLLESYPAVITAGFSKMEPGAVIYPHEGYSKEVVRVHLGIDVPEGDCALKVADQVLSWKDGEIFAFDDTYTHEAWNRTEYPRVVLLLDLERKFLIG